MPTIHLKQLMGICPVNRLTVFNINSNAFGFFIRLFV